MVEKDEVADGGDAEVGADAEDGGGARHGFLLREGAEGDVGIDALAFEDGAHDFGPVQERHDSAEDGVAVGLALQGYGDDEFGGRRAVAADAHAEEREAEAAVDEFVRKGSRDARRGGDFLREPAAAFLPERYTKSWYYGTEPAYSYLESQPAWISTWGPRFGGAYRKYFFNVERISRLTVYAPAKPAPGMPWVYRSDVLDGASTVDLALLERGFHIVVGPTTTSIGPVAEEWDRLYEYLVSKGFSAKPVLAGRGGATGEVYVWAESHPDRVAGIYGENPLMRSSRAEVQPMDNLAPLAAAGIPILHVCGSLDPNLEGQTREVERRYKALGGAMTVIVDEGKGHYPLSPRAPAPVIDIVAGWVR